MIYHSFPWSHRQIWSWEIPFNSNKQKRSLHPLLLGISSSPCREPRQQRTLHTGGVLRHVLPRNCWERPTTMGIFRGMFTGIQLGLCHQESDLPGPEKMVIFWRRKWWFTGTSGTVGPWDFSQHFTCPMSPMVCNYMAFAMKGMIISSWTAMKIYPSEGNFPGMLGLLGWP